MTDGTRGRFGKFTHLEGRFLIVFPDQKGAQKALLSAAFLPLKCVSGGACCMRKGAAKLTAPCSVNYLLFPLLSFRLSCFTLSLPFPELPLAFFAFVIGEDVGEDTPGDVLDFVLRNTGIVDWLFPAAQAGCSLRFGMKFLRCSCGWTDNLLLTAWLLSQETENAGACQAMGLMGVCILLACIISHWE